MSRAFTLSQQSPSFDPSKVVDASAFSRVSSGLIFAADHSALTGWTADAAWSAVSQPSLIPDLIFSSVIADASLPGCDGGCRNPSLFIDEDGTWYCLFDSGDLVTGWRQFLSYSTDNGLTWTLHGPMPEGLSKVDSGSYAATAVGWLEKRNGVYYRHRVTAGSTFAAPNVGLPGAPYGWDIWKTTNILGEWTAVRTVALEPGSSWAYSSKLPGSTFYTGTEYINFCQGENVENWCVGIARSSTPDGAFVCDANFLFNQYDLAVGLIPENPRVFYHPPSGKYCMMLNLITGGHTDSNALIWSSSLENWSGAREEYIQIVSAMDGYEAVGTSSHAHASDDQLYYDPLTGDVPFAYDGHPTGLDGGWHIGREIRLGVMRYSANAFQCAGSGSVLKTVMKPLANDDFTAEFSVKIHDATIDKNIVFLFRSDATGANSYQLVMRNTEKAFIRKNVAGTLSSPLATQVTGENWKPYHTHRIKVVCAGTTISCYVDGDVVGAITDASFASGTHIGFGTFDCTGEVRNLRIYESESVTVNGATSAVLGLAGGFPVDTGTTLIESSSYPLHGLETSGKATENKIYGGDVWEFASTNGLPDITVQPSNISILQGKQATVSANAIGYTSVAAQRNTGAGWATVPGAQQRSYTTPILGLANSGDQYRFKFGSARGHVYSTAATVTVDPINSPDDYASLIHWWESGTGMTHSAGTPSLDTDAVEKWADQIGAIDVVGTGTRSTDAVAFNGSQYLTDATFDSLDSAAEFTLIFDLKVGSLAGQNMGVLGIAAGVKVQAYENSLLTYIGDTNQGGFTYLDTTMQRISIVYDASQATDALRLKVFQGGVQKTLTFSGALGSIAGTPGISIGRWHNDAIRLTGSIGRVLIFNEALPDADREFIEGYFA